MSSCWAAREQYPGVEGVDVERLPLPQGRLALVHVHGPLERRRVPRADTAPGAYLDTLSSQPAGN